MAAIKGQLKKSCVSDYIDGSTIEQEGEGIRFKIKDQDAFLATLRKDKRFIYDTGFGGLHAKHVGAEGNLIKRLWNWIRRKSKVKVVDIRSRAKGSHTLGADSNSNGIVRSLQIVVGKVDFKGNPKQPVLGYADLDCENPAEDFPSLVKHTGRVIGSGIKKGGKWVWKYTGNQVWKFGKWAWKVIWRR